MSALGETQGTNWAGHWQDMNTHLGNLVKEHKIFLAVEYIVADLFLFVSDFTEDYRMGKQAKVQKLLTKIQDLRNQIETAFDSAKTSKADGATAGQRAAQYYYNNSTKSPGMVQLLDQGVSEGIIPKSFAKSIKDEFMQLGGIFQGKVTITGGKISGGKAAGEQWYQMWHQKNPTPPKGQPSSVQPVVNGLEAVSSDVSSQSSIVQSKLKYYGTNDQQFKAISHSGMASYIDQEKQPNQAMQH